MIESLESRRLLAVFVVNTTADRGTGSLRAAIEAANESTATPHRIAFQIPGDEPVRRIRLDSQLPTIRKATQFDGADQFRFPDSSVQIEPTANFLGGIACLYLYTDNCIVNDLAITGFGFGIEIAGNNNVVTHCHLWGNTSGGIFVGGDTNNITENSIHDNGGIAIDLHPVGVSLNDYQFHQYSRGNFGTHYPQLLKAVVGPNEIGVRGNYENLKSELSYFIEFYSSQTADPTGFGEGQSYLGRITVKTDAQGKAAFSQTFAPLVPVAPGAVISATASELIQFGRRRTSEFSPAITTSNDTTPPEVLWAFYFTGTRRLHVRYSEDVSASIQPDDVNLHYRPTSQNPFQATSVIWDDATNTAMYTLPADKMSLGGDYVVTIYQNAIHDMGGNRLTATRQINLLFGDANQDRVVNHLDFNLLWANFGAQNKSYVDGDFTGDGVIGFADFQVLERNFGSTLPPLPPAAPAAAQPVRKAPVSITPLRRPALTFATKRITER